MTATITEMPVSPREAIVHFMDYLADRPATTRGAYKVDLHALATFMDGQRPGWTWRDLDANELAAWNTAMEAYQGFTATTRARKLAVTAAFYDWLGRDPNPARQIKRPSIYGVGPPPITLTRTQEKALLAATAGKEEVDHRDRLIILLMLRCGLSPVEIRCLDVGDATDGGIIAVSRRIEMDAETMEALAAYQADRGFGYYINEDERREPLLLNHIGDRLTRQGIWLIVKRRTTLALLHDVDTRTLRHTCVARLQQNGSSDEDLRAFLGLADASRIPRYTNGRTR